MDEIREQMDHTKEIADAISNPVNVGVDVDEVSIFHNWIPFDVAERWNRTF